MRFKALRAVRNFVLESATRCKETPCMKASARLYTERSEVSYTKLNYTKSLYTKRSEVKYTKFLTRSEAELNT